MPRSVLARTVPSHKIICAFPVVVALMIAGCNSDRPIESTEADGVTTVASGGGETTPRTTSVTPSGQTGETSPASANSLPSREADPGLVCDTFLRLLKAGDRLTAEKLLTRTALNVTSNAELQLEPPGGPEAEYEIGAIRYATTRRKLAQVDCVVNETIDGEPATSTVTWLVRSMDEGWRISGIVLISEDQTLQDLLSFENAEDVARINSMLLGNEDTARERRAEAVPETTTSLK